MRSSVCFARMKARRSLPLLVNRDFKLDMAYGAKGVGELATIPTAPAVSHAYYQLDGTFRPRLPINHTPYSIKRKK